MMHEISLMRSILDIAQEEILKHKANKFTLLRVRHGMLANVMPEAMDMAFIAMTAGTPNEGAKLEIIEEPLCVRCADCKIESTPNSQNALFQPCPHCGNWTSYTILSGEGIFLDHIEAE